MASKPDYDLNAMRPGQTLSESTGRILMQLEPMIKEEKPDMILVQGDTTTTLCGALAGFYANVPVGHVEAGLRTGDIRQPFPEEMNRVVVSKQRGIQALMPSCMFATGSSAARYLAGSGRS